jgi:DNA-binding NarL/FixJ family response regulator
VAAEGKIRVLLADVQVLFREAVRVVLESQPDLQVVAEAADGVQAVERAKQTRPDVALLDADLPNCDGVGASALIKERVPECRILLVSGEEELTTLIRALRAGASGYLTKGSRLAELIDATRAVHRGETLVPPGMVGELVAALLQSREQQDEALRRVSQLTSREREVLALLAEGATNDGIAQALGISPQTGRTHIQNILGKLGVHSRLAAAVFVTRNGIREALAGWNGSGDTSDARRRPRSTRSSPPTGGSRPLTAGLGEGVSGSGA